MKKKLLASLTLAAFAFCAMSAPIPSYRVATNIAEKVSRTVVSNTVTRSYIEGLVSGSGGLVNATNIINDITRDSTQATLINRTDGQEDNAIVTIGSVDKQSNLAGLMTVDDKKTLDLHVANTSNPHGVTAEQAGAVPLVEDKNGNRTAVTIGSRKDGQEVGDYSLANGIGTTSSGYFSHAEGYNTTASGYCSHAEGVLSQTREEDQFAFAWNGDVSKTEEDPYKSHGPGTFNINPLGGLEGFYIGEETLAAILTNKADKADISAENQTFSDAVLAVGLNIDDETLQWLKDIGAIAGSTTGQVGIGTLLAALLAALMWLKKNKVGSFAPVGGASATVENGVAGLDDFFRESNSLLNSRLAYSRNATGLKDRAFNALSFDGTEYNLSTALAAITPTASEQPRDLLIVATATAATTISFTAGTIKGDKPTIDGSGTWLITLTEYASGVWYCRQIKMEDAA